MDAVSTFLSMGGYWLYVWPAFAVAAAVLGGLWLASWRAMRAREAELSASPGHGRRSSAGRDREAAP